MKFFLDTADLEEIRTGVDAGLVDGITTNPSLLVKAAGSEHDPQEILAEICRVVDGPISAEVVATTTEDMLREGRKLAKIADNIVVKVPLIEEGLHACRHFRAEGIRVNVTLCFSPTQALVAAKAGASYISPFVGRLDDVSTNGMQLIHQIVTIYENYDFETEVLVASVRHPMHVVEAALMGAHVATMPAKVLHQLIQHPLTDKGLDLFLADWAKLPQAKRSI
ncbi:MAG TPA: fructose-6-phosphate aldolase [Longimicrobiales bacterium]|nr:fructose-6-phosphate aldolase [Longimicrobiales bacterium]